MKVVIIDYGAGNVFSVTTALQRLGRQNDDTGVSLEAVHLR